MRKVKDGREVAVFTKSLGACDVGSAFRCCKIRKYPKLTLFVAIIQKGYYYEKIYSEINCQNTVRPWSSYGNHRTAVCFLHFQSRHSSQNSVKVHLCVFNRRTLRAHIQWYCCRNR